MLDIEALAKKQLYDYREVNPGGCFNDRSFQLSLAEAYQLQDAVAELREKEGDSVGGFKIGCIGDHIKSQFGMSGPIRGTLFKNELYNSGISVPSDAFCNLSIEAEMAFIMGENGRIQSIFPVIELHNYVFRSHKRTLTELIANNGLHAGVILPSHEVEFGDHVEVNATLSLTINDAVFQTTKLWPINDTPQGSLAWLLANPIGHESKIKSGHMILAGTTLGLYPVRKGDQVAISFNGQKIVTCLID
ncbi:hypothetical protein N8Z26_03495 [Burkholderiales bacterium]|nr:hypothetical protein [Burkholderiales bacterium]